MDATPHKVCFRCGAARPLSEFYRDKSKPGGIRAVCKTCERAYHAKYREENRAAINRRQNGKRDERAAWRVARRMTPIGFAKELLARARARHAARFPGDEFICVADILPALERGTCELSGLSFNWNDKRSPRTPSLDRIDSSRGYVKGNVRIVCFALNVALSDWGFDSCAPVWIAAIEHNRSMQLGNA